MGQTTVVFLDESGFRLLPSVKHTWAPIGKTPLLKVPLRWSRLSVMGAISHSGKLYTWIQKKGFRKEHIRRFLQHLLQHIEGPILLVWDNLSAHKSKLVQDFITDHERLAGLHLPPYAPDLNPVEWLWSYMKTVDLANLCCYELSDLRLAIRRSFERLRHRPELLLAFVQQLYDFI